MSKKVNWTVPLYAAPMEPGEISEFAKELREAGEARMTHVSLIISVLAVLVALVTVFSHRQHTEAVLSQAKASDQWGEYQGRRIRQAELGVAADLISSIPGVDQNTRQTKLNQYKAAQAKAQEHLDEDTRTAKEFEAEVTMAEKRAMRLDAGEALLQISVVLASITLLTRRWTFVLAAIGLGSLGLVAAASALLVR